METQMDSSEPDVRFRWVRDSVLRDAGCVTLVHSGDLPAVVRAFGGDPDGARRLSLAAAENLALDGASDELVASQWIAVRMLPPWILVVEVNGWQGSRPEVLTRVSAGTRAVSAYWNENAGTQFSCAVAGQLLTTFDAVFPGRREGTDPDSLEALRADLDWDGDELVSPMLALAARVTGQALDRQWLDGELDVIPVEPVAEAVRPSVNPDSESLTYDDPPLAWALRQAGDGQLREAAWTAARYAARAAGIEDQPDIALTLREETDAAEAGLARLVTAFLRDARKSGGDPRPGGRYWAVTALREAANPLPLAAAFRGINAAGMAVGAFGIAPADLRELIIGVLGDPRPPSGSMGLTASPGPLPTDKYAWTSVHWLATAGAISFLRGLDAQAAARLLHRGEPEVTDAGIPALSADPVAAIREVDGWAIVVESHERGSAFAPPQEVSSPAVTITWSARGRALLYYSASGRLLAMLDPQAPDQVSGDDPAVLAGRLGGLRLGPTGAGAAACLPTLLALAERLTGVAFDPGMLDQPHLFVPWSAASRG
jgi:hypothetical protein